MTDAIYAAHAHSLKKKGYSPLPLPPGEKSPPPFGWTGALAHMASGPDVQFWIETEPADANIALRLPDGVIGIDIDHYAEKTGADSVREAIAKFGQLPSSGRSSARPAPAGIRLFRVPPGTKLAGTFKAAGLGPHVDIIQHHHRYLVAPPSVHPEGGTYGWYTLQNELAEFPAVDDLPELPEAWIEGLKLVEKEPTVDHPHDAWDAMDARTKNRVGAWVGQAWSEIMAQLQDMKEWDDSYTGEYGGWELTTLALTASLASLVKADWNEYDAETAVAALELALPHDGKFTIGNGVSKFLRALEGDNVQARPYPFPEEDDSWFEDVPEAPRPFADAGDVPGTLSESELATTAWPQYEQNDFGNSQRIAAWAKGNLYWLHDSKVWVRYNGVHWEKSPGAGENAALEALNVAYELEMDNYREEKTGDETASPREKFRVWVMGQKMAGKYAAAAKTAQMSEVLNRSEHDFDADPYKLGVLNGTVDLRTGELAKGTKGEMIATVAPVNYRPDAECPRFEQYLEESLPDPEVRAYLQRALGYSITGVAIEQVMFMHHGVTSNGKSVLMNILAAVMGDYSGGADPRALIESKQEQHSTHVASLYGPRVLLMSETARGARLNDTLIKQITAGDEVIARKLYQENERLKITGKIHIVTNHLPHIVSAKSTNRRIQLINWPVEIAEEKIDLELAQKILATEMEGVLAWLIRGSVDWWQTLQTSKTQPIRRGGRPSGLGVPAQVLVDTAKYLRDEDEVGEWLDERVVTEDVETIESCTNLYRDYRLWVETRGGRPMSQKALSVELEVGKGFVKERTRLFNGYRAALKPLQQSWFDAVSD